MDKFVCDEKRAVEVVWHGHACFEVKSGDKSVVFDPYLEVPGYAALDLEADLVLVSHEHDDHNARERVKLSGRPIDVSVKVLDTCHDDQGGKLRGPNIIHIVDFEGVRVAHFGDLGRDLSPEELEQLKDLDVAFIPVGGFFTIDANQAATIIRAIKPDVTVPMHYFDGVSGWNKTSGVEPFLEQFTCVTMLETNSFTVGSYHDCILVLSKPC
jgi:L-ascorbate metabolism protein UlaG (beta-lactamase superfamily)